MSENIKKKKQNLRYYRAYSTGLLKMFAFNNKQKIAQKSLLMFIT